MEPGNTSVTTGMEPGSAKGVLGCLSFLETQRQKSRKQPPSRVQELRDRVEELKKKRERLRHQIQVHQCVQRLRTLEDHKETGAECEEDELLKLMLKQTQLRDVLLSHHLLGGYDVRQTNQDKCVVLSFPMVFEGTMLETYHVELSLRPSLRLLRHDLPPFIAVERLCGERRDVPHAFDTLSLHLHAFTTRRGQLRRLQGLSWIQVLESNPLVSVLVLVFTEASLKASVLCSLEYGDLSRSLPTRVCLQCEEQDLSSAPQWQKNTSLIQKSPLHEALSVLRRTGQIL